MQPATNLGAIDICRGWRWIGLDGLALGNGHGLAVWMLAQEYSRRIVEQYATPFTITAALAGCGASSGATTANGSKRVAIRKVI
jgi:hypothetical protein